MSVREILGASRFFCGDRVSRNEGIVMRVWLVWPGNTDLVRAVVESADGVVSGADAMLIEDPAHWADLDADVVLVNSLTPGASDFLDWMVPCHAMRSDIRWVIALPRPDEHPATAMWPTRLFYEGVFDWVVEGPRFREELRHRLTTPRSWQAARQAVGGMMGRVPPAPRGDRLPYRLPGDPDSDPGPPPAERTRGPGLLERVKDQVKDRMPFVARTGPPSAAPPDSDPPPAPPTRREVVVASPAKPVVIAVVGVALGVGTSSVVVGVAERLHFLGQRVVIAEVDPTLTYSHWRPELTVDVAPGQTPWSVLPTERKWSYIVVDCHIRRTGIPPIADLILVVGPGAPHRWGRWEQAARALMHPPWLADYASVEVCVGPDRYASHTVARLKTTEPYRRWSMRVVPDLADPAQAAAWDPFVASFLPGIPTGRRSWWRLRSSP